MTATITDLRDFLSKPRIRGYHYRKSISMQPTDGTGTPWANYLGPFCLLREQHCATARHWMPDPDDRARGRADDARLSRIFNRCTKSALAAWIRRCCPGAYVSEHWDHYSLVTYALIIAERRLYPTIETAGQPA